MRTASMKKSFPRYKQHEDQIELTYSFSPTKEIILYPMTYIYNKQAKDESTGQS